MISFLLMNSSNCSLINSILTFAISTALRANPKTDAKYFSLQIIQFSLNAINFVNKIFYSLLGW